MTANTRVLIMATNSMAANGRVTTMKAEEEVKVEKEEGRGVEEEEGRVLEEGWMDAGAVWVGVGWPAGVWRRICASALPGTPRLCVCLSLRMFVRVSGVGMGAEE